MDSGDLARKIVALNNQRAANSNFQLNGWEPARAALLIQATIDILNEHGLLSGCLLCKNSTKEKDES